jgi:hypothetical protein
MHMMQSAKEWFSDDSSDQFSSVLRLSWLWTRKANASANSQAIEIGKAFILANVGRRGSVRKFFFCLTLIGLMLVGGIIA